MRALVVSTAFRKDLRRLSRRGKDISRLEFLVDILRSGDPVPARYRLHPLKGEWAGFIDCHVEPDWILICRIEPELLTLVRTGNHADVFKGY